MLKKLLDKHYKKIIGALFAALLGTSYVATGNPKVNSVLSEYGFVTQGCGCGDKNCKCEHGACKHGECSCGCEKCK